MKPHSGSIRKAPSKQPVAPAPSNVPLHSDADATFAVPDLASAENVIQLQRVLGNRTTIDFINRQVVTRGAPSTSIQRSPEEIAAIEKEIGERQTKQVPPGKARQRNNAQIKKLQIKLEELKAQVPVKAPEPEKPKEPTFAEKYPELAGSFSEEEIKALFDAVADTGIKGLTARFTATELKDMYDAFGATGIGGLPGRFGLDVTVTLVKGLTAAKLKDLASAYPDQQIKNMLTQLGIDPLKDLMNTFTGSELKAYVATVGAPKLVSLMTTQKLTASALKKYGAAWLKTFIGANGDTMAHLLGIYQKSNGVISGGHDDAVFRPFINEFVDTYTVENDDGDEDVYDMRRGRITNTQNSANFTKVSYRTHRVNDYGDGYEDWTGGSKTLIKNLQANQNQWLKLANEAIWNAIRAEAFDPDVAAWSGTADNGITFNGFYSKPKVAVDTFFPV